MLQDASLRFASDDLLFAITYVFMNSSRPLAPSRPQLSRSVTSPVPGRSC
jgi:hypothetical protein